MALGVLLDAAFIEKLPTETGILEQKYLLLSSLLLLSVPLSAALYWLWWKSKVKDLKDVPTTSCNKHLTIAMVLITTLFRNKVVDTNVLFFQLLQGMVKVHQMLGYGVFYMWTGMRPVVICFRSDFFEAILKSTTNLKKSFDYSFLSLWLKDGLVTSHGSKWKQRRRAITATFHFRILEDFVLVFDEQSRVMINKLKQLPDRDCIDIVPFVTMCTLDIICETAMGIRVNAQNNGDVDYLKAMHKVCQTFVSRVMRPWLWPNWVFFSTAQGQAFKRNAAVMDVFTRQVIRDRKKELLENKAETFVDDEMASKGRKKALLDLLLELHLADVKNFTESDVQEEVDSFMFAGHDTTAASTSWALYLLGLHLDVQVKVQEEIDSVFGNDLSRQITENDLRELKYLDCVIKETQRLYAPAPFIGRELQEDVTINGTTIPKGTTCMLLIYMLHRDENVYPKAEVFDPSRFFPENVQNRHPYAYCPFSAGPRSCIGQRFAMLEEKVVICNFLRNFNIRSIDQRDRLHVTAEMVLRSRNGIRLEITPRT